MSAPLRVRLHRFLLRLWGTRGARCPLRVRFHALWATTWRHAWSYEALRGDLERMATGEPVDLFSDRTAVPELFS